MTSSGDAFGAEWSLLRQEHAARIARYAAGRERAVAMSEYLADLATAPVFATALSGDEANRRARDLRLCGSWLHFRDYFTEGEIRLHAARFCQQDKLCPVCALRRAGRSIRRAADRVLTVLNANPTLRPYLVTLTVRDGPDLAERLEHLRRGLRLLNQRRRDALRGVVGSVMAGVFGGAWSIELKRGSGSGLWHPHSHAVWLCEREPSELALSAEWKEITGDSFVVDVRPFHHPADPASDLCEVFKYALKLGDLSLPDNLAAWIAVRGRRLLGAFGFLHGVVVDEELVDEPLSEDLPFIDLVYRHIRGEGYRCVSPHLPATSHGGTIGHGQEENQVLCVEVEAGRTVGAA